MQNRIAATVAHLVPIMMFPALALAQQTTPATPAPPAWQWGPGPMMWNDGYGWHGFWGGPFLMIAMIFAFVWVARLLFGHARWRDEFHHAGRRGEMMDRLDPNRSALRILNDRFARGEIQKDEYEDRKATLLGNGG